MGARRGGAPALRSPLSHEPARPTPSFRDPVIGAVRQAVEPRLEALCSQAAPANHAKVAEVFDSAADRFTPATPGGPCRRR